tara:strand:+ start:2724 stop:3737 length:1014 start_codon:yes stop_codon:yes gene_type:complete
MKIFICQTPFQLYYSKRLVDFFNEQSSKTIDFVIIHSGLFITRKEWISNVTFKEFNSRSTIFKNFTQLKSVKKYIDLRLEESNNQKLDLYVPHIGGILANYLYFNKHIKEKNNVSLNLYYEGILYFYDFKEMLQVFHLKRFLFSLCLGFCYRYQKTILPYSSRKIKYIYTPIKQFTKGPKEKITEIPLTLCKKNLTTFQNSKNVFLILGGPVEYIEEFYRKSLEDILQENILQPKIYYKGHSSFQTHNVNFKGVFDSVADELRVEYIEITEQLPIEKLIDDISPSIIYSYYSSALINIQLMSNEKRKIKCYLGNYDNNFNQIKHIFEFNDIEIIDIK